VAEGTEQRLRDLESGATRSNEWQRLRTEKCHQHDMELDKHDAAIGEVVDMLRAEFKVELTERDKWIRHVEGGMNDIARRVSTHAGIGGAIGAALPIAVAVLLWLLSVWVGK